MNYEKDLNIYTCLHYINYHVIQFYNYKRTHYTFTSIMILFFVFLSFSNCLEFSNLSSYSIDFYTKNTEYILFQGSNTTIYLYEEDTKYMLFIGAQSGHEIYSADIQDQRSLKFSFGQEFRINDIPMKMESKFGVVNTSDCFIKTFQTPVEILHASNESSQDVQLCLDFTLERTTLKVIIAFISMLIVATNYGHIKTNMSLKSKITNAKEDTLEMDDYLTV